MLSLGCEGQYFMMGAWVCAEEWLVVRNCRKKMLLIKRGIQMNNIGVTVRLLERNFMLALNFLSGARQKYGYLVCKDKYG